MYIIILSFLLIFLLLSIFCHSIARFTVGDSYRKIIGAMNQEIQKLKSMNDELIESKLKAVRQKSDYEKKCEQQEAELKAVRKEKSDYKEKCEQQEAELKAVRKKQQEAELKVVHKDYWDMFEQQQFVEQVWKISEALQGKKKPLVLHRESIGAIIKARPSVTNIELDIAFDGELYSICNYVVFMC